jgi:hypothetical protein
MLQPGIPSILTKQAPDPLKTGLTLPQKAAGLSVLAKIPVAYRKYGRSEVTRHTNLIKS